MTQPDRTLIAQQIEQASAAWRSGWKVLRHKGPGQIQFWFIALLIGIAGGFAAMFFRKGITALQGWLYGTDNVHMLHSFAASLPWYWILLIPVVGGLVVGVILHNFTQDGRVHSVAEVIEGAALNRGQVRIRAGLASAAASFITLSSGGSTGREGPVVHLASLISTLVCRLIRADGITGRDLLGCAVAAAVSASFNAPIAGALFALEVILRHFAMHAFAPIVIASVAGTVITRLEFGDITEFVLPGESALGFYVELPAYLILGLVCGVVAAALMRSVFLADILASDVQSRLRLPRYLRPAVAGALLGLLAIWFPHIIGVGYETTSRALTGDLVLHEAIVFAVLKVVAVSITFGGRMGGGIFSPSLMLGALTGLAYGMIATSIFPQVSGSETLYALAGMGALAAAVLGAPISTTLIVFELTGDWQTGIAVMVSVSLSSALASRLVDRSFFLTALELRNVHLAAGPQTYLLSTVRVAELVDPIGGDDRITEEQCWEMVESGIYTDGAKTLEAALPLFEQYQARFLPVVTLWGDDRPPELLGVLHHVAALKAYNRALAATAAEEHS